MARQYRDVTVDGDGVIVGQRTLGRPDSWIKFSANRELLHISEALERYPDELGGYDGPIWRLQDGYGEPGFIPCQGWDWSGIRDSSPEAIQAMYQAAREYMTDAELDEMLGLVIGEARIKICRRIVADHLAEEIDGVLCDVQTAHVLTLIWDKLGPASHGKFETVDFAALGTWAWKQVR